MNSALLKLIFIRITQKTKKWDLDNWQISRSFRIFGYSIQSYEIQQILSKNATFGDKNCYYDLKTLGPIQETQLKMHFKFAYVYISPSKIGPKLGFQTLDFRYIILKINPPSVLYFFHLDETCLYSHKYSQSNLDMIWQLSYQFEYKLISSVTVSQKLLF